MTALQYILCGLGILAAVALFAYLLTAIVLAAFRFILTHEPHDDE